MNDIIEFECKDCGEKVTLESVAFNEDELVSLYPCCPECGWDRYIREQCAITLIDECTCCGT